MKNDDFDLSIILNIIIERKNLDYNTTNIYYDNETDNLTVEPSMNCILLCSVKNYITKSQFNDKVINYIYNNLIEDYTYKLLSQNLIKHEDVFCQHIISLDDIYDIDVLIDIIYSEFDSIMTWNLKHNYNHKDLVNYLFKRIDKLGFLKLSKKSFDLVSLLLNSLIRFDFNQKILIPENLFEYLTNHEYFYDKFKIIEYFEDSISVNKKDNKEGNYYL